MSFFKHFKYSTTGSYFWMLHNVKQYVMCVDVPSNSGNVTLHSWPDSALSAPSLSCCYNTCCLLDSASCGVNVLYREWLTPCLCNRYRPTWCCVWRDAGQRRPAIPTVTFSTPSSETGLPLNIWIYFFTTFVSGSKPSVEIWNKRFCCLESWPDNNTQNLVMWLLSVRPHAFQLNSCACPRQPGSVWYC